PVAQAPPPTPRKGTDWPGSNGLVLLESVEVINELCRRCIAAAGGLLKAFQANGLQVSWDPRPKAAHAGGVGYQDLGEQFIQALRDKRRPSGKQCVKDSTEAIDIGRWSQLSIPSCRLLRSHVGWSPDQRSVSG